VSIKQQRNRTVRHNAKGMAVVTGGQALARALRAEGIEIVFGIVGTHNATLFDGLFDVPELRVIAARHETSAGFMADGYARASGRIAACMVVPGPGVTNLMTALGQAYLDSVPILAIAGQNPSNRIDHRLEDFHELHAQLDVVQSVTVSAQRLKSPAEAPTLVRAAIRLMRSQRPRPTFIEVPLDVAEARQEVQDLAPSEVGPVRSLGDQQAIRRAVELLQQAKRPLTFAGGGVISAEAGPLLRAIAGQLGAPVIMTVHGRGAIPDDDPLSLGDGWSRLDFFDAFLAQADVCLAVGTNFETVTDSSRGAKLPNTLIHVDIDPTAIGRHRPATIGIVGDAQRVLQHLAAELGPPTEKPPWCDMPAARAEKRAGLKKVAGPVVDLLDDLRSALPRDAIVADDLCLPGYWSPLALEVFEPRTLLHPGMFGTLGYALPAAIGAQLGRPDRVAVALAGDGGFLYTSQELATAVQQQVNVVAIVFNDNAYGALRLYQDRMHGGRRIGVDLTSPDFSKLAEAYGARGVKLRSVDELHKNVAEAVDRGGVSVIECPLDSDFLNVPPPWL
jgi:thiamine pyrophosphate-dependent acetolactate synthase large subunit-like protein